MITEIITLITISYFATGCDSKQKEKVVIDAYRNRWENKNGDGKVWINEFNDEKCIYKGDGMWFNEKNGEKWVNETLGLDGKNTWINGNNGDIWFNSNNGSYWKKISTIDNIDSNLDFWDDNQGNGSAWINRVNIQEVRDKWYLNADGDWIIEKRDGEKMFAGKKKDYELPFPYTAWLFNKFDNAIQYGSVMEY